MFRVVSVLLLLLAQSALADAIYVQEGSSGTSNGSAANPFSTIQEALLHAVPGTVIKVSGKHTGPIHIKRSGTRNAPISIVGGEITGKVGFVLNGCHDVRLAGIEFNRSDFSESTAIRICGNSSRIDVHGCTFHRFDKGQMGIHLDGSSSNPVSDVSVRKCSFTGMESLVGTSLRVDGNVKGSLIVENAFADLAAANAVEIRAKKYTPRNGVLRENDFIFSGVGRFKGRASTGVSISGAASIDIVNNTMISGGRGIAIVGAKGTRTSDILIERNNIRKNDFGGILIDGTKGTVTGCSIRFNKVLDNDYDKDPDVPVRILGGKNIQFIRNFVEVDNPLPLLEFDEVGKGFVSNFNDFHYSKGAGEAKFIFNGELVGFDQFQSQSKQDSKSKFVARGRDSSGSQTWF